MSTGNVLSSDPVLFWVCDVHTGVVEGRLDVVGSWSLTNRFEGGTASFTVPVGHLLTPQCGFDWPAIRRVHALLSPGDHSVLATWRDVALGEWVVTRAAPSSDGDVLEVSGDEWEMYLGERSVQVAYEERTGDMYTLARWILDKVFTANKVVPIQLSVPSGSAGVSKTIGVEPRGMLWVDVWRELTESSPPMEWRIDTSVEWDGSQAVRAVRTAVFGRPTLKRASSLQLVAAGRGQRSGNILSVKAGRSWRNWSFQVGAVGAGDGDKRIYAAAERTYAEFPKTLHRGVLSQHTDVTSRSRLLARAQGELAASWWSMDEPLQVDVVVDRLPVLPRVGTAVQVIVEPQPAFPDGVNLSLRVGEFTVSGSGSMVETGSLQAA